MFLWAPTREPGLDWNEKERPLFQSGDFFLNGGDGLLDGTDGCHELREVTDIVEVVQEGFTAPVGVEGQNGSAVLVDIAADVGDSLLGVGGNRARDDEALLGLFVLSVVGIGFEILEHGCMGLKVEHGIDGFDKAKVEVLLLDFVKELIGVNGRDLDFLVVQVIDGLD